MNHEILLMLHTSFAHTEINRLNEVDTKHSSYEQKLEEACANGIIKELLPEVFNAKDFKKNYLWQMHPGLSFLQLEFGESPLTLENSRSINPHNFLNTDWYN